MHDTLHSLLVSEVWVMASSTVCPGPRGIIMAESGFTPARALLDRRRARFAQRLYARPQGGQGPEEILERESTSPRA